MRRADLNPPLGKPGGPCHLVERIRDEVDDPVLEERLINEVERGRSLSNPDAAKVYSLEVEPGVGFIKQFVIGPHAAYRMDLRSVTVNDVRQALQEFLQEFTSSKSREDSKYIEWGYALQRGDKVEYLSSKKLLVVFSAPRPDRVRIITTFWKGRSDPRTRPGQCSIRAGFRAPAGDLAGFRIQDRPANGRTLPQQVLPLPERRSPIYIGNPSYTLPSSGGGGARPRTLPTPGENSPKPEDVSLSPVLKRRADLVERDPIDVPPGQRINRGTPRQYEPSNGPTPGGVRPVWVHNPGSGKVFPSNKSYANRTAARIVDIARGCSPDIRRKAARTSYRLKRADRKNRIWTFAVQGKSGVHTVRVKALPKGRVQRWARMDVQVSCSCPLWQWGGPEHWAKVGGYLYGKARGTATRPKVRDPKGERRACHHVLAVLAGLAKDKIDPVKPQKRASGGDSTSIERVVQRYLRSGQTRGE